MQTQENEINQTSDEVKQENIATAEKVENPEVETEEKAQQETTSEAKTEVDALSELQAENAALKAHLEQVEASAKANLEKMVRAIADADNQRKRAEADVERERKYGIEKFAKALLPVVDALELAITHANRDDEACKAMLEGVENTLTLFLKEMKPFGVEVIDPQGQIFDPNFHNAITMVPSDQVVKNGVLQVMQKGYLLNGRVVRPAMVMVSAGPGPKQEEVKAEAKEETLESKKTKVEF